MIKFRILTIAAALLTSSVALAETSEVKISKGFGVPYLPMMVMQDRQLLEKHAAAAGLGNIKVTWATIDGGNVINDAMLSGALDIATIGPPGFATLWNKTQSMAQLRIKGIAAVSSGTVYLNTRNPNIKTLRDFGPNDRIAVPGIKTSAVAMILQMGAEKEFGTENFAKLDPLTVGLPHPEAVQALVAGKTEVNSHFASQPFAAVELRDPSIRTVIDSTAIFGGPTTVIMAFTTHRFHDANPKTYRAFVAALDEADAIINADKRAAADTFVKLSGAREGRRRDGLAGRSGHHLHHHAAGRDAVFQVHAARQADQRGAGVVEGRVLRGHPWPAGRLSATSHIKERSCPTRPIASCARSSSAGPDCCFPVPRTR
jgi:NitT/TauT family transport system substrate-binding protein